MQIDWFTLAAQLVNFVILVALLQRLLYRPLVGAMERREREIEERLEEGARMQAEARERADALEVEREALERERSERLRQAEREAETRRSELLEEAREEVEERRRRWREAVESERESFLEELRRRMARQVVTVSRRVLRDLATNDLERRAAERFVDRMEGLDGEWRQRLGQAIERSGEDPVVESAFELGEETRERIRRALESVLPEERTLRFRERADVGFGVELVAGALELGWSLERYLDDLEQSMETLLSEEARSERPAAAGAVAEEQTESGAEEEA